MLHPRARTMLLLSLPAVAIGIASSLILIMVMKIASVLQNLLWQRLPGTLGIAQDSPLWIIGVLTLTGIAVGLVIRFSQGHAGPDPACEPLIGAPVPPSALPGLIVALILGLAGGVSLGPEHPIMTVNIALAVAIGARLLPRVNRMEWTILASAGTIGALFGTPVAAALIFSQTLNGSNEVPLWDRLFAPLMAAAAGALTTGLFFHPHFSLPIAHYGQMEMTDILSGAIVAAIAIAAGMVAVWCLPRLHAMMHQMKNPVFVLGIGGLILGILGVIGGPVSLFKGLDEMQQMVANQAFSTSDYFLAAALMAFTPLAANASEITLLPSIKLQIGDRDHYGNYWDGGHWRDRDYWHRNYEWRKNRWWRHDNGYHRGWDKRKAYERGYREGWRDRDDHRGKGRGHGHRH